MTNICDKRHSTMNKLSTLRTNISIDGIYVEHSICADILRMRNIAMRTIYTEGRSIEQIHSNEKHTHTHTDIYIINI